MEILKHCSITLQTAGFTFRLLPKPFFKWNRLNFQILIQRLEGHFKHNAKFLEIYQENLYFCQAPVVETLF